uniref:3-dehydroquinate synthase N-terminal domain-containing protein n=1 Tax=Zooxanthella nutricula TaxID=1333877 RepID=A0A7S2NT14_9DINO
MCPARDHEAGHGFAPNPRRKTKERAAYCALYSKPLPKVPGVARPHNGDEGALFHRRPDGVLADPAVPYIQISQAGPACAGPCVEQLLAGTPLPKGAAEFSSLHVVSAAGAGASSRAASLAASARGSGKRACCYAWPALAPSDLAGEYEAFFSITSEMILNGADRASLLVFVAAEGGREEMAVAAILGMLPFRGVQVAFVTDSAEYCDPLGRLPSASGLFEYCAEQPERMGRCPLAAIFGPLEGRTFSRPLAAWRPLKPAPVPEEKPAPFKIGAMELPMVTYEGEYRAGVERLAGLLRGHFGEALFPVVAVGETGDALGYGSDIHAALGRGGCEGYYFAHASGESFKRPDAYGRPELLAAIAAAKRAGRRVVVVAVGGGVNGNAMGMIAALTGADFVEVPTTLMHYNDATTSAKKAFSLVVNGQILSKNILGTFYLPQLVFCISEVFLTLSSCSVHAAVGEAAKTMSMLGKASSAAGQQDFHNILGAAEFASDFTRVIHTVPGFERLILFLRETGRLKEQAMAAGRALHEAGASAEGGALETERREVLARLRGQFHGLPEASRREVMAFLTAINEEVIKAKAMFLAYSDPFEKYRALLFEYAHTLGHGVEAFMNGLYRRAEDLGIDYSEAFRLHGQCVGMAVLWAGEMSKEAGHLEDAGYMAHQSLVYLFNRYGGFDFAPLRRLCDELDVSQEEFCEGVLRVVRRDNKRGYCACAPGSSVDQLVRARPGCLLRSADPSAELRYLVEVSEESQSRVLERAFEGEYDKVLVFAEASETQASSEAHEGLSIVARGDAAAPGPSEGHASSARAAAALDALLGRLYMSS